MVVVLYNEAGLTNLALGERSAEVLRRRLAVLVATAMMLAMMVVASPAFAGPGGSENSCGKANPSFPAKTGQDIGDCGVENNQNFPDKPEGQPFQD